MRRVVITGVGAVSPCGLDTATTWSAIKAGKSGIAAIGLFDPAEFASKIAGECKGFDPERYVPKRDVRSMDRFIHLAMGAAHEVMESCGISADAELKQRTGTLIGVGIGGLGYIETMAKVLAAKGPGRITPYFIPGTIANLAPGQVSMKYGLKGVNYSNTSACASGAHAIGEAFIPSRAASSMPASRAARKRPSRPSAWLVSRPCGPCQSATTRPRRPVDRGIGVAMAS